MVKLCLSVFLLGSLLMSAPSLVETSTSTDSGDWLYQRGDEACWLASSSLPASTLPSAPTQTAHQPSLSLSDLSWGEEGWGDRLRWDEQFRIHQIQKLLGREGEPTFFFFFLILYLYFFPKQMEPFCLIAPDTDCVCTEVSRSMLAEFVSPFKTFFEDIWEADRRFSNRDNSTLVFLLLHYHHTTHWFTVLTSWRN